MEYKRLTNKDVVNILKSTEFLLPSDKIYLRLAELEDKIESGLLVELPCGKPCERGDKYYKINVKKQKIFEGEITYINYDKTYGYICQFSWQNRDYMVPANLELLGTSFNEQLHRFHIYKTQAEADAMLEELRRK